MPAWSPFYGGSTWIMSPLKEYLAFPLALWLEPILATKLLFVATRVAAAAGTYAIFARCFRSPLAGWLAGYAFAFGSCANHQERHLDIAVSYAARRLSSYST